nr:LLM class flavin-dependent oxidoreductase [Nocardia puris]
MGHPRHRGVADPESRSLRAGFGAGVGDRAPGHRDPSSVLQDHPFSFARKICTLDHLSRGRIGWNVVTSALRNSARNFNLPDRVEHDARS